MSVPSNVWANNEAETYPSGPTEPVEEMDEATIAAKVEGASDGKKIFVVPTRSTFFDAMIHYVNFQSSNCMTQMIAAGLINSAQIVEDIKRPKKLPNLDERSNRLSKLSRPVSEYFCQFWVYIFICYWMLCLVCSISLFIFTGCAVF